MSKSYRKYVKVGVCCGNNTKYYKNKRRRVSNKNNHILRNALAKYDADEIDEHVVEYKPPKGEDWDEPTDGTWTIDKKSAEKDIRDENLSDGYKEWLKRKVMPKLKKRVRNGRPAPKGVRSVIKRGEWRSSLEN